MKKGKRILLFAPRGFEDLEVAAFTDIIGWTRVLKGVKPVDLVIAGFKKNVRSKHNLTIKAQMLLNEVKAEEYGALIIPGGFNDSGYTEVYHKKVYSLIQDVYNNGGIIVAMCVASLPVARTGILEGRRATTYTLSKRHDNLQILKDCGAVPVTERIVVSDRIITNRGPDTAVDVAFTLLEMISGEADMKKVKEALMFE
jgi:4-methyl-5(b-hydroxyethyl)-thiazole monophosphate biosynthesis